jgi:hypothetical protein
MYLVSNFRNSVFGKYSKSCLEKFAKSDLLEFQKIQGKIQKVFHLFSVWPNVFLAHQVNWPSGRPAIFYFLFLTAGPFLWPTSQPFSPRGPVPHRYPPRCCHLPAAAAPSAASTPPVPPSCKENRPSPRPIPVP